MYKVVLDEQIKKDNLKTLKAAMSWLTKNYGDVEGHRVLLVLDEYNEKVACRTVASKKWRIF